MLSRNVDTLHWGFALEFSTLYLTSRFTPRKLPKQEPLNQVVPFVEVSFHSPRGEKTGGMAANSAGRNVDSGFSD
jgi:hypothetical protein